MTVFDFSRTFRGVNTDFFFNFSDIFLISPTSDLSDFLLNRAVRAVDVAISLKKRVDSWSGPIALCGLRSSFRMPSFPTIIFGASGVLLVPKFGMVLVFS
jgi:hypothetical protein